MKTVDDILQQYSGADARRQRPSHPKGFEPGIVFDVNTQEPKAAAFASPVQIDGAENHRKYIEDKTGLTIPDHLDVVIERLSLYGGEDGEDEDGNAVTTKSKWWYKYKFVPRTALLSPVSSAEIAEMMKLVRSPNRRKPTPLYNGQATLNIMFADWQVGKKQGGGSGAFLERFVWCIDDMVQRAKDLKKLNKGVGTLNIFGLGDLLEGCFIYPNQAFEIDLDRRAQIKIVVACIIEALERLAPFFSRVNVLAIPGNHGEHRVGGKRVNYTDNDDVLVFEMAAREMSNNPRYAHVGFIIAHSEPSKTLDVNGWVFGATHGQVFGTGAGVEKKVENWFKNMTIGRMPVGDADVLLTAHYHHEHMSNWGSTLWWQSPALDGGSQQFTDMSGKFSRPGMASFVTTPETRFNDLFISYPPVDELELAA